MQHQYTFEGGLETWTVDYTYNNVNQLLTEIKTQGEETVYSYTYTYDDNGNSLNDPKTGNTITYDYFLNKPIAITGTDGTITYTYNGKGELISRSKTQNETTITNTYFWDENGYMINEGDGTSITHSNLVGLNGIFARFDGAGATYYGKNAHGDVIYTQNNLTITKHYDYDPFGNEINPDETDTNPFRYCGEYFDVHSGTYYLRNRYYYPRLGRFTTEDPARDGLNWYVYCGNNPLVFVDSFGLEYTTVRELVATSIDGSIEIPDGADYAIVRAYGNETKVYFDPDKNDYNMDNINGTLYMEREEFLKMMNVDAIITTSGEYEIDAEEANIRHGMYNASLSAAILIAGMKLSKKIPAKALVAVGAMSNVLKITSDAVNMSPFVEIEPGTYEEEHFIVRHGKNIHSMTVSTVYGEGPFPTYTRTSSYTPENGMNWDERAREIENIYGDNMTRLYRR